MHLEHGDHDTSRDTYKCYPKVRKLDDDDQKYAEKATKSTVNWHWESRTPKRLKNIAQTSKRKNHETQNDLSNWLRSNYGGTVDICTDVEDNFCGLFIQDNGMRETFEAYPEIIFVDATYKLLDLQLPVYLLACEDSNGASEIVGMGMLVAEEKESVKWLFETFKNKNSSVMFTRLVMVEKDMIND